MDDNSKFFGWVDDPILREEAFSSLPENCKKPFQITGKAADVKRMMLFEIVRKVTGGDIENIAQQVGDCVSWGAKHALEYLQCCQIAMGNLAEFKLLFSPYLYGCGRVFIGGNRMRGDGSVGVWQAQACMKYGAIPLDGPNVPEYSGRVARQFGSSEQLLNQFVPMGQEHLLKTTAKIRTWDELVQSICNLHPVTIASNVGFDMQPRSDGFNHYSTHWGHQMCIIGVDDEGGTVEPHACILNSWGDIFGHITDFRDPNLKWPVGTIRARKKDIEAILSEDDSWAYSFFTDFPGQALPIDFFDSIPAS
jgi:hypothetical protein